MSRELFCESKNGVRITWNPIASHPATHFHDNPQLAQAVKEILSNTNVSGEKMDFDIDTGSIVGLDDLVETNNEDVIIYAKRKNRDRYSRFVKNRKSRPSSMITIALRHISNNEYDLYTTWVGYLMPSVPEAPSATDESKPFWRTHALVYGTQELQPGTETTDDVWELNS